jgi:acyl-coenzyme A thioesterase PaaI-like protein
MAESWRSRSYRWFFNWFPAYRGTGARVTYIAGDWSEIRIAVPLSWRTRNYVGTIFGGSMYGAIDPMYMIMLIKMLGPNYIVWDKGATIRFRRPGRDTLTATFVLSADDVAAIRADVDASGKTERDLAIDLVNASGVPHASFTKLIHIRKRDASVILSAAKDPSPRSG